MNSFSSANEPAAVNPSPIPVQRCRDGGNLPQAEAAAYAFARELWEREDLHSHALSTLLPGVAGAGVLTREMIGTRAYNAFGREGIRSIEELLALTPRALRALRNFGRESFVSVVVFLARLRPADGALSRRDSGPPLPASPASTPRINPEAVEACMELLAAVRSGGAVTVGDAIQVLSEPEHAMSAVRDRLLGMDIFSTAGVGHAGEDAWREFLSFDANRLLVLRERTFARGKRKTLTALARTIGCSEEWVHNLEKTARHTLQTRRQEKSGLAIASLAEDAAEGLDDVTSKAMLAEAVTRAVEESSSSHDDVGLRQVVLEDLMGFKPAGEDLALSPRASRKLDRLMTAVEKLPAGSVLPDKLLHTHLHGLRVHEQLLSPLREHTGVKAFRGHEVLWRGTRADKACALLSAAAEPLSLEDLLAEFNGTTTLRSLRQGLLEDQRICRAARGQFALVSWGLPEYTNIVGALEREINDAGGSVRLSDAARRIASRYGVTEASVRQYAATSRFTRSARGRIEIAREADGSIPSGYRPPAYTRGVYKIDGVPHLRIDVDENVLRGSGRPVRIAIVRAAGLAPGDETRTDYSGTSVHLSWGPKQPTIGSTRALAQAANCRVGDRLLLPLQGPEPRGYRVVRGHELARTTGVQRLARELGLESSAGVDKAKVASALWLPSEAPWRAIKERLVARSEDDLADLIDDGRPPLGVSAAA